MLTNKHLSHTYANPTREVQPSEVLERRKAALLDPRLEAVHAVHMAWMQRAAGMPPQFKTN